MMFKFETICHCYDMVELFVIVTSLIVLLWSIYALPLFPPLKKE
jgi:hypothetical protein